MKVFVQWVLQRRYRLILVAVAFATVLPLVSTALLALETIRRGGAAGVTSSLGAAAGIIVLGVLSPADVGMLSWLGTATVFAGVALGLLVRAGNSLALAFQGSLLFCAVSVLIALTLWPDPSVLIGSAVEELVGVFQANGATDAQLEIVRSWNALFFGVLAAVVFAQLVAALLLAYWWSAFANSDGQFGRQFRSLKLGRVLGIPATILMAVSLVLDAALVQNLFPLALFGFWFQGLAVGHAWARARQWHPLVLGIAYILLVTPLTGVIILGFGSVGLVDNWFDLRAPLKPMA
ncbi:MAG: hypothetical protein ACJ0SL_08865 [Candidatus Rariloculaceae bacterium]